MPCVFCLFSACRWLKSNGKLDLKNGHKNDNKLFEHLCVYDNIHIDCLAIFYND